MLLFVKMCISVLLEKASSVYLKDLKPTNIRSVGIMFKNKKKPQ